MTYGPQLRPAPSRAAQMVVADPTKLSYFAQAQAARFNVRSAAGSLRGFGDFGTTQDGLPTNADGSPMSQADINAMQQSGAAKTLDTVAGVAGSFLNKLLGTQPPPAPRVYAPLPQDSFPTTGLILGGVALAGLGFVAYKKGWFR